MRSGGGACGKDQQPGTKLDPDVEAKLDEWVSAKRQKDFATADDIRADLRSLGLDPDRLRPAEKELMRGGAFASPVPLPCPSLVGPGREWGEAGTVSQSRLARPLRSTAHVRMRGHCGELKSQESRERRLRAVRFHGVEL